MTTSCVRICPLQHARATILLSLTIIYVLSDATFSRAQKPNDNQVSNPAQANVNSVHRLLGPSDYKKFQVGRTKDQILKDVQWRGNFEMGRLQKGARICAISFEFFSDQPAVPTGEVAWAIFVDEEFQKFVRWPKWETKDVPYEGLTRSVPVPIRLGDFHRLDAASGSERVTVADLAKDREALGETPRSIDPGLGIVFLLLRASVVFDPTPSEKEFKANASLRDQFNASRFAIGMTERQVDAAFRAKPIYSGECKAGRYAIYGSHKAFDIGSPLHYSNVLILYQDGRANGIYSGETVPGGDNGLRELRGIFLDLPESVRGE